MKTGAFPFPGRGRRAFGYFFFLALAWLFLWWQRLPWASFEEVFWLTLLYTFCVLPAILFAAGHRFRIPLMPMWGLGYFMMFGMPMLSPEAQLLLDFVSKESIVQALELAALGAGSCLLAFYTPLGGWVEGMIPRIKAPWDLRRAPTAGVVLSLLGLGIHHYTLTSTPSLTLAQILFILSQLSTVGMLTLFLLQLRGQLSWRLKVFLWGFVAPVEFLFGLGTGAVWKLVTTFAPLLFIYAAQRGRVPWQALALGAALMIPFAGLKHEYRSYAWYGEEGVEITASPLQRGLAFLGLTTQRLSEGGIEVYTVAAETTRERVSHLGVLIAVVELTPLYVSYWGGESYQGFFWALVPRFLFPDKPRKTLGQEFGHRYGFLSEEDTWTSFNFPHQVVEMYANFGFLGVLIGMAIFGWVYRAIATLLARPESGERSLIIGCSLLANMLNLDSDFSLVIGGVFWYVALMFVAVRLLKPPVLESVVVR